MIQLLHCLEDRHKVSQVLTRSTKYENSWLTPKKHNKKGDQRWKNMHCIGKNKLITAASWTEPKQKAGRYTDRCGEGLLLWTLLLKEVTWASDCRTELNVEPAWKRPEVNAHRAVDWSAVQYMCDRMGELGRSGGESAVKQRVPEKTSSDSRNLDDNVVFVHVCMCVWREKNGVQDSDEAGTNFQLLSRSSVAVSTSQDFDDNATITAF